MRPSLTATLVGLPLLAASLTGCVSARDAAGQQSADVVRPSLDPASACSLLDAKRLTSITGTSFLPLPTVNPESDEGAVECQWTATSQEALVLTKEIDGHARSTFQNSLQNAERNLGAVTPVAMKGTDGAYVLPALGRTAMIVDGSYVEVTVLVPGASAGKVAQVSRLVAANAAE
ncbi:MAG: hypothetical protein U0R64_05735 [Candidatus Nanopelagicales bacterium]